MPWLRAGPMQRRRLCLPNEAACASRPSNLAPLSDKIVISADLGKTMWARLCGPEDGRLRRRGRIRGLHSAAVRDIVPRRRGARANPGETVAMIHRLLVALTALAGVVLACPAASAHPHVWITVKSELVYAPDGSVTGVRHAWTFDDMFSVFATQGIEAKKKGQFTREELAPLAEVNVTSLKEYDYFTYAKASGKKVEFEDPQAGYYLDFDPKD